MRILPVNQISFKNNKNIKKQKPDNDKKSTGLSNTAKLSLGIGTSIAASAALYFVFRKTPSKTDIEYNNSIKLVNDTVAKLQSEIEDKSQKLVVKLRNGGLKIQYSTPVKEGSDFERDMLIFDKSGMLKKRIISKYNAEANTTTHWTYEGNTSDVIKHQSKISSNCLVKKVEIGAYEDFNAYVPNGKQKLISVFYDEQNVKTHMNFYNNNMKLHQMNVYEENPKLDELINRTEYNFAYDSDGKFAGYTKQNHVNNFIETVDDLHIYMKDGKEYKSEYIDNLYVVEPRFEPKNF